MRLLASARAQGQLLTVLAPLTIHYLEHSRLNSSGPDYRFTVIFT
jgi:hypothetical protein